MRNRNGIALSIGLWFLATGAMAQAYEDGGYSEPSFWVNGYLKQQSGVFVPLFTNLFEPNQNEAWVQNANGQRIRPCDPIMTPNRPCYPVDHGTKPGHLSIFRGTLQLEADWKPHELIGIHAIARGVRSMKLEEDAYGQIPVPPTTQDPALRRQQVIDWINERYYSEFELREAYLDARPWKSFSLRLGRQQIAWGETGQYRLLDVINPTDETWHFGPLESFEDTRIPLWTAKGVIDLPSIDHSLELVWVPLIDDPEDTVTVPLTFVGAWGLPYPNTPSPFLVDEKVFLYPGGSPKDMRGGLRWKGTLGHSVTYSLVYYYTHQLSPPVPLYYQLKPTDFGSFDPTHLERFYLGFPRQHIAGLSFDYTFESPIGMVVKLEASVEPDRTYPVRTDVTSADSLKGESLLYSDSQVEGRYNYRPQQRAAVNYALVLMRPTMIRFLNPTQNFMIIAQWMHTIIPGLSEADKKYLVAIPGYDEYALEQHAMSAVLVFMTSYFHGLLDPKLIAAYVLPDSLFYTLELAFRFGENWRVKASLTDFYGPDPYQSVGLFRDRDEVALSVLCQF